MSKKVIKCESEEIELGRWDLDFGKLLFKLNEIAKAVPEDAKMQGYVSGYDDEYYTINFVYHREETDSEYKDRLIKESFEKKRVEDDEKEIYRRLKEKYE